MEIQKKLFELRKEVGKIGKDSKNPFFNSKYFLLKKGFVLSLLILPTDF